jgi:hypothetical protein
MTVRSPLAALVGLMILCAAPVMGQTAVTATAQGASVYSFYERGQPTIAVQVWGDSRAGLYVVEQGTDLNRLLTIAGGPAIPPDHARERVNVTVSITRLTDGVRSEYFSAHVDDLSSGRIPPPTLAEGDIVRVDTTIRPVFNWRDGAQIVSTLGTLALLVLRITDRL